MPTPIASFHAVAAQYGNVDPGDAEAVQRWLTETLPTLPPEAIEEILEALLADDGADTEPPPTPSYPRNVPLPSLSASPPAAVPLLAAGWRELLARLAGRRRQGS